MLFLNTNSIFPFKSGDTSPSSAHINSLEQNAVELCQRACPFF